MRGGRAIVTAACAVAFAGAGTVLAVARDTDQPVVTRDALAQSSSVEGAPDRTLGMARVVIPPRASIPLHHHEGTQIAQIRKGVLTYKVATGHVDVMKGQSDQSPELVRRIAAGEKGKIRAGEWIVEQPSVKHSAANRGKKKIVILLANLLRTGAPPSTPD